MAISIESTVAAPSFFDGFPVVSQLKSLVLVIGGDADGARIVQMNFLKQAPVVSQIYSIGQVIAGDPDGARRTQEIFLDETVVPLVDGTPIIGQVKASVHYAMGDKERGDEVMMSATRTTGTLIGGIFGGPVGAVGGLAATDALLTAAKSINSSSFVPVGTFHYAFNIDQVPLDEHFDQLAGIVLAADSGLKSMKTGQGKATKAVATGVETNIVRHNTAAAASRIAENFRINRKIASSNLFQNFRGLTLFVTF